MLNRKLLNLENLENVSTTNEPLHEISNNAVCATSKGQISLGIVQSVTCLATDASLTAAQGVMSSIPAWSHTFVEIMK